MNVTFADYFRYNSFPSLVIFNIEVAALVKCGRKVFPQKVVDIKEHTKQTNKAALQNNRVYTVGGQ